MGWNSRILVVALAVLAAVGSARTAAGAGVVVHLTPSLSAVAPGDTFEVRAEVPVTGSAFNAFELIVRFDPTKVTFIPTTPVSGQIGSLMTSECANNFHMFSASADSAVGDVSLLCAGTSVNGPGRIYQLKFKANAVSAVTEFTVGVTTRFYNAGIFVNPVERGGCLVRIGTPTSVMDARARGFVLEAPRPNPSRGGGGSTIEFALPSMARVSLELFDPLGRRVAAKELGETPAGRSHTRWTPDGLAPGRYDLRLRADGAVVGQRTWVVLR